MLVPMHDIVTTFVRPHHPGVGDDPDADRAELLQEVGSHLVEQFGQL